METDEDDGDRTLGEVELQDYGVDGPGVSGARCRISSASMDGEAEGLKYFQKTVLDKFINRKSEWLFHLIKAAHFREGLALWKRNKGVIKIGSGKYQFSIINRRYFKDEIKPRPVRKHLKQTIQPLALKKKNFKKNPNPANKTRQILKTVESGRHQLVDKPQDNMEEKLELEGISNNDECLPDEILIDGRPSSSRHDFSAQESRSKRNLLVPKRYQDSADDPTTTTIKKRPPSVPLHPNRFQIGLLGPKYPKKIEESTGYREWSRILKEERLGNAINQTDETNSLSTLFFVSKMNESGETEEIVELLASEERDRQLKLELEEKLQAEADERRKMAEKTAADQKKAAELRMTLTNQKRDASRGSPTQSLTINTVVCERCESTAVSSQPMSARNSYYLCTKCLSVSGGSWNTGMPSKRRQAIRLTPDLELFTCSLPKPPFKPRTTPITMVDVVNGIQSVGPRAIFKSNQFRKPGSVSSPPAILFPSTTITAIGKHFADMSSNRSNVWMSSIIRKRATINNVRFAQRHRGTVSQSPPN